MKTETPGGRPREMRVILRGWWRYGGFVVILAAILFLAAGRLDWGMAWAYVGVQAVMAAVTAWIVLSASPDLLDERARPKDDAKGWDRWLSSLNITLWPLTVLVAGLDARFGWSPQVTLAVQLAALGFVALGNGLSAWAVASNRFYSRVIRIQADRGHTVVSAGPYRFVRHPGYVGVLVRSLATPLALGSWWALLPVALSVGIVLFRTAREDQTLRDELDGYRDYAGRVRYRLVPGVW